MTSIHELGHALDCELGGGVYRSGVDPVIRRVFQNATQFVTPYAVSGRDEFFAENWRAYLGANDPISFWPTVTRARLEACAPTIPALFEGIDVELTRRPRTGGAALARRKCGSETAPSSRLVQTHRPAGELAKSQRWR